MSKKLFLSIIIPCYNSEKYLSKCIDSCINQNLDKSEYEIIIVNDGSTDNSIRLIDTYVQKYANIKCILKENGGLSSARNAGLQKAKGDYVWFVDSDDWISEDSLLMIKDKIKETIPDVLCLRACDVKEGVLTPRFKFEDLLDKNGIEALQKWVSPCAPFYVFKRGLLIFHNLLFYRGIYHEDSEFTPRALFFSQKVSYLNYMVYNVYANPTSITRGVNTKRAFDTLKVCRLLEDFMNINVPKEDWAVFSSIIAISINSSLYDVIFNMDKGTRRLFDLALYKEKELLWHFWNSNIFKYKLEYLLLKIDTKHPTRIYSLFINNYQHGKN